MFLGGVMKATGNAPPALVKAKGKYMAQDLHRTSLHANVDLLETPSNFLSSVARKVLQVQRLLTAAEVHGWDDEKHLDLAMAFSHAIHADASLRSAENELDIAEPLFKTAFKRAAVGDDDATTLLELASSAAVKKRLQASTEEAVTRGAFGSPTVFVSEREAGGLPHARNPNAEFMCFGAKRTSRARAQLTSLPRTTLQSWASSSLPPGLIRVCTGSDRFEQLAYFLDLPWHGPDPPQAK
jgi:2-hydroxychromene-2-carboxylate isomerase